LIFCSEPVQPGGAGATSKDIRKALRKNAVIKCCLAPAER
jgi:hypothetical protein